MTGKQLKQSIQASEGRVVLAEVIGSVEPLYPAVTNAELAAAFGADIILLNMFDVFHPVVKGVSVADGTHVVRVLKALVGRPIGINLEPVDLQAQALETLTPVEKGRTLSVETLQEVKRLGFDFVCLTGNPKSGVSNREICTAIELSRRILGENGLIIAGKMHGAGVAGELGAEIITETDITKFVNAGADVILLPAPGTVPGMTVETVHHLVQLTRHAGALSLLAIGTSQEGSDHETIRQIALNSKMCGADIHHLGDAGYHGVAVPENIMTYSIAIRGKRHTYMRMASSIAR